jgi:hypothetical protein
VTVLYSETSITRKNEWRKNGIHKENTRGYLMDGQNAAGTSFGVVLAGTVMALKANGKARPSGAAQVQGAQVGVNEIDVDDASNIFLSDVISLYDIDGTVVAAARNVTGVDKTSTPNTVTIDGAVVTAEDNGFLLVDDGWIPIGVLEDQPDTIRRVSGTNVEREHLVTVGQQGNAQESRLIGMVDLTKKMLAGGMLEVATTFDGMPADGQFQSLVAGFLFY